MNAGMPEPAPKRRKRLSVGKLFRRLFYVVLLVAVAFVLLYFGPNLYMRLLGNGETTWISERFSEELKSKNELVVFETTLTGNEVSQVNGWLIGAVQKVSLSYTYTINYVVDLSAAVVTAQDHSIVVELPMPRADYHQLTVDKMVKNDTLYPLSPERYQEITTEIEEKLYQECSTKQTYLDAAWDEAVKSIQTLFRAVVEQSGQGTSTQVIVQKK